MGDITDAEYSLVKILPLCVGGGGFMCVHVCVHSHTATCVEIHVFPRCSVNIYIKGINIYLHPPLS